jgi:hypothetical protein
MKAKVVTIVLLLLSTTINLNSQELIFQEQNQADTVVRIFLDDLENFTLDKDLKIVQDPRITRTLRKHYDYNKEQPYIGWKVLVYRGKRKAEADELKAEFVEIYGSLKIPVTVKYQEPDFYTLVGAFRTKEAAFRFKELIRDRYPLAYLVVEQIRLSELE